jgi:hypothetical protein
MARTLMFALDDDDRNVKRVYDGLVALLELLLLRARHARFYDATLTRTSAGRRLLADSGISLRTGAAFDTQLTHAQAQGYTRGDDDGRGGGSSGGGGGGSGGSGGCGDAAASTVLATSNKAAATAMATAAAAAADDPTKQYRPHVAAWCASNVAVREQLNECLSVLTDVSMTVKAKLLENMGDALVLALDDAVTLRESVAAVHADLAAGRVGGATALVTFIVFSFVSLLRWCECSCDVHFHLCGLFCVALQVVQVLL